MPFAWQGSSASQSVRQSKLSASCAIGQAPRNPRRRRFLLLFVAPLSIGARFFHNKFQTNKKLFEISSPMSVDCECAEPTHKLMPRAEESGYVHVDDAEEGSRVRMRRDSRSRSLFNSEAGTLLAGPLRRWTSGSETKRTPVSSIASRRYVRA